MSAENTVPPMGRAPVRLERVSLSRLVWVGPLVVVAAVAANVIFSLIVTRLFGIPPDFTALTPGVIAVFTAVGVIAAVIVFALVGLFSSRPIRLYRRIALAALLISFLPDLAILIIPGPTPVGILDVLLLAMTHAIAWAISVELLTRLTHR